MNATEKIDAFGVKALAYVLGVDLATIWRWKKALASGKGISDANKRRLIAATAAATRPITWVDFLPAESLIAEEAPQ